MILSCLSSTSRRTQPSSINLTTASATLGTRWLRCNSDDTITSVRRQPVHRHRHGAVSSSGRAPQSGSMCASPPACHRADDRRRHRHRRQARRGHWLRWRITDTARPRRAHRRRSDIASNRPTANRPGPRPLMSPRRRSPRALHVTTAALGHPPLHHGAQTCPATTGPDPRRQAVSTWLMATPITTSSGLRLVPEVMVDKTSDKVWIQAQIGQRFATVVSRAWEPLTTPCAIDRA